MHYSTYIPDPAEHHIWKENAIALQQNIQKYVDDHKLRPLRSNNFGTNSYFYDNETNTMYVVNNFTGENNTPIPVFKVSTEESILRLNELV